MRKIVIYGLGNIGQEIARKLIVIQNEYDFVVVGLMDKRPLGRMMGYEVYSPNELPLLDYDDILVTSQKWYMDISDELKKKYGISRDRIIRLNELVTKGKYYCNLCESNVPFMLDTGIESPAFVKRKIIGGGRRENCMCPICCGGDRERWLQYVLDEKMNIYESEGTTLHFAPEYRIEEKLRKNERMTYITADIEEGRADKVEDITKISFGDQHFDYIICNHILEHIKDERNAFVELKRCLKARGKIIFSVPICWDIDTLEDDSIVTNEDRLREYGQEDHVRLYGKDLEKRLKDYGFKMQIYRVKDCLKQSQIEQMNLILDDTIWILSY